MAKGTNEPTTPQKRVISAEKKELYKQASRANYFKAKSERKKEKEENRENERRLAFLHTLIKSRGLTLKAVAERLGVTQQLLTWIFSIRDDCRLSMAQDIASAIGYRLTIELTKGTAMPRDSSFQSSGGVSVRVQIDQEDIILGRANPLPEYIRNCKPEDRMYFLASYIDGINKPITKLCQTMRTDMSTLKYIFVNDDAKVAKLYEIAQTTGGKITWKLSKL